MQIERTTERTSFCQELPQEKQLQYFGLVQKKILPAIDNIYFNVFIKGDTAAEVAPAIAEMVEEINLKKEEGKALRKPISYKYGLVVSYNKSAGNSKYNLCLTNEGYYDIFLKYGKLTNNATNRIHIQLRALGLWTRGNDIMLAEAYDKIVAIMSDYGLAVSKTQENRIDYCYHTNIISSLNKVFFTPNGYARHMKTSLKKGYGYFGTDEVFDEQQNFNGTRLSFNYICFGRGKSNNYLIRFYDKSKEVIEEGYKFFFFDLWHKNGLISYYDKWCMEYIAPYKKLRYYSKAQIAFYAQHGTNQETLNACNALLNNKNATLAQFKALAKGLMPKITPVFNIEFQTMRKFYVSCNSFIERKLEMLPRENVPPELERIYKILDNREYFLEYLTRSVISFYGGVDENGERNYLDWWKRLRNTKVGGIKAETKLLREYSHSMDFIVALRRHIGSIVSCSEYLDLQDKDFSQNGEMILSCLSDNAARKMELYENAPYSDLTEDYALLREKKHKQLKNRSREQFESILDDFKNSISNREAIEWDMDESAVTAICDSLDFDELVFDDDCIPDDYYYDLEHDEYEIEENE